MNKDFGKHIAFETIVNGIISKLVVVVGIIVLSIIIA